MIPPKLKAGDHIRVIAPSDSLSTSFGKQNEEQVIQGFKKLGLTVSFGKHVRELNDFETTTIEHRLEDLHDAYSDPGVKGIVAARGGSNVTQLLKYIDYELVRNNPKIFCGLSDITALSYALYKKTGVVNYYGPHFTMLGTSRSIDYSFESFRKTLMQADPVEIKASEYYNNAPGETELILNEGYWTIQEGEAAGKSIGGNFLTTNFVLGSEFMPELDNSILFLEENHIMDHKDVQNELQSLLNHVEPGSIRGLLIGRFQQKTGMTRQLLSKIIHSKKELEGIPVVANLDFGHTSPMLTLPVGGKIRMEARKGDKMKIEVTEH